QFAHFLAFLREAIAIPTALNIAPRFRRLPACSRERKISGFQSDVPKKTRLIFYSTAVTN
ncbi:MAG TPA: hypothetical protein VGR89_00800, partial [Puia sp.]|nr:hypothetical protein [Puia sp.]